MAAVSGETAVQRARAALSLADPVPAWSGYVERLDDPGHGYYLVVFGSPGHAAATAAVDATSGDVSSYARLPGAAAHLPVDAARAAELAGAVPVAPPRLVWRPCRASRSMLSPMWEVPTAAGPVYIDQQSQRWTELGPAGPGG